MKPTPDAPQVGSVVTISALSNEKFVIGGILRGGMGEVYQLVPVAKFGYPLALKTYQQSAPRDQFLREAEIWISLGNHPHIARAFMYLEWQSKPSIIASWYKQPVNSTVAREWSTAKIIDFATGLIDGLEYAFKVGHVIHQDIKPANILLDEEERPRLADFGMARFATRLQPIRGIADVDASMVHLVTIGPVGGTPFYMAPELFAEYPPSVQTDIFSLGVTLYEIISGEHPYCGPETGRRLVPSLRSAPLRRFREARGSEATALIALVTAALELDPGERPASYDALYALLGGRRGGARVVGNTVQDVIAKASLLRDTGRHKECVELLQSALAERPTNPELLNSYAIQLLKLGSKQEAYSVWETAAESLTFTSGRHEHAIYVDPVVNLAWQMVREEQFDKANELLTLVGVWCRNAQYALSSYMEMGWWHLYNGRFENAWEHILTSSRSRAPDELSLWSLTLAAWLSNDFEGKVNTLGKLYLNVANAGETTALLACVIAARCLPKIKTALFAIAYPKHEARLAIIAKEAGLASPDWRGVLTQSGVRLVIRALDAEVTGGKNVGTI